MGKPGRVSKEELELRLAETARLLVRKRSYMDVERELAARFGVDMRTARKWIRTVKRAWTEAADVESAEDARADLIAQLDAVLTEAWNHKEIVRDKEGNPVLDQNATLTDGRPNPGYQKPLVMSKPKIQNILHAVSQLRALRGADRPIKHSVKLDADINAMPDIEAIPDAVQSELRKELEKLTNNGDLRSLAGEWFRKDGTE
jgi:hypothetical protein